MLDRNIEVMQQHPLDGSRILVLPLVALGDLTIFLHLAWRLSASGAQLTISSDALFPARGYFPWLNVLPHLDVPISQLAAQYDLVIASYERFYLHGNWSHGCKGLKNVALVTAKKISRSSGLLERKLLVNDNSFEGATCAFCKNTKAGLSMVKWVDHYVEEVFKIDKFPIQPILSGVPEGPRGGNFVLIFPTTPEPRKNFWLLGFRMIARSLSRRGWRVEFACMSSEQARLRTALPGFPVKTSANLKELIEYVGAAEWVISNDSGGGHLASLMNKSTITITRRSDDFVWRPGFNVNNTVIHPYIKFKVLGRYIWRPFVPVWQALKVIGFPVSRGSAL
ncbi:ADP-heptose--LPS heptosyltransferase [Halopseudomonas nanhaiensis]|uniref:glycosyltransferase family 9 protein n=1 Tax=Halopseudomonas nanhaiensis TaxID=2830842 RepID=UPI001CBCD2C5|nr:glycosyltransferase family 9 protein [Halopseudomonas nanhaiensis]UAW99095.1 ADP-heptose--LPS heptosyltransferase [Halopseudomonas nanhaiensis]